MLIDALKGQNFSGRPPVWLMRQAGRYLPEFRAVRAKHSFWECVFTPSIATEITLMPEKLIGIDALILFADILVIFEKFRGKVVFPGGKPYVECSMEEEVGVDVFEPIFETIRRVKKQSNLPLIGFAGGPYTTLTYLTKEPTKKMLEQVTAATREYLEKQIEAGVDAIQVFDSWAAVDGLDKMKKICFPYVKELLSGLKVPTIFFAKQSSLYAKEIVETIRPTAIGLDSSKSLLDVRREVGDEVVLQGNLSPEILLQDQAEIKKAIDDILDQCGKDPRFIFNLGHGVMPNIPQENVKFLVSYIKSFT